jgi:hypothetical protein
MLVIATLLGAVALGTEVASPISIGCNCKRLPTRPLSPEPGTHRATRSKRTPAANATSTREGYACLNGIDDPSNTKATRCPNPVNHPS